MPKDEKTDKPVEQSDNTAPAGVEEPAPDVYRIEVADGIAWENKRARYGSRRSDLPAQSIPWLLRGGYISKVTDGAPGEQGDQDADV